MVIIKKGQIKIEVPNDSFMTLQDTSDGMYFKFKDGTEIRFELPVTNQIKAISNMIMKSTASDITIDFNSKNIISFSGGPIQPPKIIVQSKPQTIMLGTVK